MSNIKSELVLELQEALRGYYNDPNAASDEFCNDRVEVLSNQLRDLDYSAWAELQ